MTEANARYANTRTKAAQTQELQRDLSKAWLKCDEQDYQQERLDRELKRIFGGEFVPFAERYPDVKKPK